MPRLFISHSNVDVAEALAIVQWLSERGFPPAFLARLPDADLGLVPGEHWRQRIDKSIAECESVLVLLSPEWSQSDWCFYELATATQQGKDIFGVVLRPADLSKFLKLASDFQRCDLTDSGEQCTFDILPQVDIPSGRTVSFSARGLQQLSAGLQKRGIGAERFAWPRDRSPYRGLAPMEPDDAAVYFGRDAALVKGLDALRRLRFENREQLFVIYGGSGVGKSSFLRAGLWRRLLREDTRFYPLPLVNAGRAVLTGDFGLVSSLVRGLRDAHVLTERSEVEDALTREDGLARLLILLREARRRVLVETGDSPPTIILPIDQGEQLFLVNDDTDTRKLFSLLSHALRASRNAQGPSWLVPVITLRSESLVHFEKIQQDHDLSLALFELRRHPESEIKAIIESPAKRATEAGRPLAVLPALTERLAQDARDAGLPLLAFTLERLFIRYGEERCLSVEHYEALGGLQGVITAAAEQALERAGQEFSTPDRRQQLEKMLRRGFIPALVTVDHRTGQPLRRTARWDEIPADVQPLFQWLVDARLLFGEPRIVDGSNEPVRVIEVAHEALLREWSMVRRWIDEDAEPMKVLQSVRAGARDWKHKDSKPVWLVHHGERLLEAEALLKRSDFASQLEEADRAYIEACRIKEDRDRASLRRSARLGWALAMLCLVICLLFLRALREERARRESLTAGTAATVAQHDPTLAAMLLATVSSEFEAPGASALAAQLLQTPLAVLLRGHQESVWAARFDRMGRHVVTSGQDRTVRVWRADGGGPELVLSGHFDSVSAAVFSPDGTKVASASVDQTARIWSTRGSRESVVLEGHGNAIWSIEFSRDGNQVVTASSDRTARVWPVDGRSGAIVLRGHDGIVETAVFSPDARRVLTASHDGTARIWTVGPQPTMDLVLRHKAAVSLAIFNPDGTRIATLSRNGSAYIWRTDGRGGATRLQGHSDDIEAVAFSPDGEEVATSSEDGTVRLWSSDGLRQVGLLGRHASPLRTLAFSPDGALLAAGADDGIIRIWNRWGRTERAVLRGQPGAITSLAFDGTATQLVSASASGAVRIWALMPRRRAGGRSRNGAVRSAAISADGRLLVTAESGGGARISEIDGIGDLAILPHRTSTVSRAVFSKDGLSVATLDDSGIVRLWANDSNAPNTLHQPGQKASVWMSFSPDGRRLITASKDGVARVWGPFGAVTSLLRLEGDSTPLLRADFSPAGRHVAIAGEGSSAWLRSIDGSTSIRLLGHAGRVQAVAFSPNGKWVATAAQDSFVRVFSVDNESILDLPATLRFRGHIDSVFDVSFSPDSERVVSAGADGTARIWHLKNPANSAVLSGHTQAVTYATFSPGGRYVLTESRDGTLRLWPVDRPADAIVLRGQVGDNVQAVFSQNDERLVVVSSDGVARVWNISWPGLLETIRAESPSCLTNDDRRRYLREDLNTALQRYNACERLRRTSREPSAH
jgi:WD40 repeat protein